MSVYLGLNKWQWQHDDQVNAPMYKMSFFDMSLGLKFERSCFCGFFQIAWVRRTFPTLPSDVVKWSIVADRFECWPHAKDARTSKSMQKRCCLEDVRLQDLDRFGMNIQRDAKNILQNLDMFSFFLGVFDFVHMHTKVECCTMVIRSVCQASTEISLGSSEVFLLCEAHNSVIIYHVNQHSWLRPR